MSDDHGSCTRVSESIGIFYSAGLALMNVNAERIPRRIALSSVKANVSLARFWRGGGIGIDTMKWVIWLLRFVSR